MLSLRPFSQPLGSCCCLLIKNSPRALFSLVSLWYFVCASPYKDFDMWLMGSGTSHIHFEQASGLNQRLKELCPAVPSQHLIHKNLSVWEWWVWPVHSAYGAHFQASEAFDTLMSSDRCLSEKTGHKLLLRWQEGPEGLIGFPCL